MIWFQYLIDHEIDYDPEYLFHDVRVSNCVTLLWLQYLIDHEIDYDPEYLFHDVRVSNCVPELHNGIINLSTQVNCTKPSASLIYNITYCCFSNNKKVILFCNNEAWNTN